MIGKLVDELSICNAKLYAICDKKADAVKDPGRYTKKQLIEIIAGDLAMCRERSRLRQAIDNGIKQLIIEGKTEEIGEYKNYGLD
jgi:hypothetical protein